MISANQENVFARMGQENHKWIELTRQNTVEGKYDSFGQHDLIMAYAEPNERRKWLISAATKFKPIIFKPPTGDTNFTREYGWEMSFMYEHVKEVLTDDERAAWESSLKQHAEFVMGQGQWGPRTRLEDTDTVIGHIALIKGVDRVLKTGYTTREPSTHPEIVVSYSMMIAARRKMIAFAKGGEWPESDEYNLGTLQILLMGELVNGELAPEVDEWLPELATQLRWHITPDLKAAVQWGDSEHPHDLVLRVRIPLMLQVISAGGDKDGKLLQLVAALLPSLPDNTFWNTMWRAMWLFDPKALPEFPQVEHPLGLRIANNGLIIYRTLNTVLQVYAATVTHYDHQINQWDTRLWQNGDWILDSPRCYAPWTSTANAGLVYGLALQPDREIKSVDRTQDGCIVVLTTKGPRYPGAWEEPPSYTELWSQTITLAGNSLKRIDQFQGSKPTNLQRYQEWEKTAIESSPVLQQLWHTPPGSEPTAIDKGFTWLSRNETKMKLTSNRVGTIERAIIGVNLGQYAVPSEGGGWLIRFVHDVLPVAEIESVLEWGELNTDINVKGVIRGKQLIIELP